MTTTLNRFIKVKSELYNMQFIKSQSVKAGKMEYQYFELSDFMPQIIELCTKHKVHQYFTIENDSLYVKGKIIICREDDNQDILCFSSCPYLISLIQNPKDVGAMSTYLKRYTYLIAFDITEDCKMEQQIAKQNTDIDLIDKINRALRHAGRPVQTREDLIQHTKETGRTMQEILNDIVKKYRE